MRSNANITRSYPDRPIRGSSRFEKVKDRQGKTYLKEIKVVGDTMTLAKRHKNHRKNNPNDKNSKSKQKGVYWGKKGFRDKQLAQFYKEHIYTFVDENDLSRKGWVRISGFTEEEQ